MSCHSSSLILSLSISFLYVGSLYIWINAKGRDNPSTIKKRFASVAFTILTAVFLLSMTRTDVNRSLFRDLGLGHLSIEDSLKSIILPILLTCILFAGPIVLQCQLFKLQDLMNMFKKISNFDLIFIRNYVVAPLTEEVIFRSVLLAFLLPCWSPLLAVLISSILFGFSHSHHYFLQKIEGPRISGIAALFQIGFTSLFGLYSSCLYLKTGHVLTPILVHSFCNMMGFPDFEALTSTSLLKVATLLGFICWIFTLILYFK